MTTPADEDEFTELVDFRPDRVDLVGKGANGIGRFLIAKQDQGAGLLDPGFVRELVDGTGQPGDTAGTVTITGSPASVAKTMHEIHAAAQRKAELDVAKAAYEAVIKAKYHADDLKRMAGNGQAMKDESYPIADVDDLDNAIHAVGRGGADHDAIRRHVISRAKALGKSSMIPDNWNSDGSMKTTVSKDASLNLDAVTPDEGDLDGGRDGLDPTVPFADPGDLDDLPGDPTDPGSPAWEAIDAATAQKWLSILARAYNAIGLLADREMLEAVTADPDDAMAAYDLQDAQCALDYVIGQLAVFAAGEQAETDLAVEAMEAVGKAVADAAAPLGVIEGLAAVRKAGRVLSAVNEARIRQAAESLQQVLASLPQPVDDSGQPVAKEKEGGMPETDTAATVAKDAAATPEAQARDSGPVDAGGTTGLGEPRHAGPAAALPGDGPQQPRPGDPPGRTVVKADDGEAKPKMMAVYDSKGRLIGIVDPGDITEVAGADGDADGGSKPEAAPAADGTAAVDGSDLEPQPSGEAGTPSEDVAKTSGDPIPATGPGGDLAEVIAKSVSEALRAALAAQGVSHEGTSAEQAQVIADLTGQLAVLKARIEDIAEQPAMPKVVTNGAVPPAHMMRGQDQGAGPQIDVTKAMERRRELYRAPDARRQNEVAEEMKADAIGALAAIHQRR